MNARWRGFVQPLVLLAVSVAVIRYLPAWTRPTDRAIDCSQQAASRETLEQCVALHPDDVELLAELAADYVRASSWTQAESVYRKALSVDPFEGDLRVRLSEVLLARGDLVGARQEAMKAAALQPGRSAPADLLQRSSSAPDADGDKRP